MTSGYAEGARLGAPDAIQVADRFHLLYNLTHAVDRVVRAHRTCFVDRSDDEAGIQQQPTHDRPGREGPRERTTRQRHAQIHQLHAKGVASIAIQRDLNLDAKTVRRYLRAATADELLTELVPRAREIDSHLTYLADHFPQPRPQTRSSEATIRL